MLVSRFQPTLHPGVAWRMLTKSLSPALPSAFKSSCKRSLLLHQCLAGCSNLLRLPANLAAKSCCQCQGMRIGLMSAAPAVMSSNKGLPLCQYMMRQAAATLRAENTEAQPATST